MSAEVCTGRTIHVCMHALAKYRNLQIVQSVGTHSRARYIPR